ncbi:MAG: hypothetical protein AAFP02_18645 [Bacteroidota bacterium]
MKTFVESTLIGRIAVAASPVEGKDLFKVQLAHDLEHAKEGQQRTFWYTILVKSPKLADYLIKGQAIHVRGQLIPNLYNGQLSYTVYNAEITLLERPSEAFQEYEAEAASSAE